MKKRLLSILLTLCMVFSLLPTAALATSTSDQGTDSTISVKIGEQAIAYYVNQVAGWNAAVGATEAVTVKLLADWKAAETDAKIGDVPVVTSFGTGAGFEAQCYLHVPESKTITLDLNGHTLDRGLGNCTQAVSEGKVISVNGTLTLKDSGTNGRITGAYNLGGSAVDVQPKSTFTMQGGSITGNNATSNESSPAAGGVYVGGTFTMTGGSITRNKATDNTATDAGSSPAAGGVLVATGTSGAKITITVGGTAQITGNLTDGTANNVLLQTDKTITCSTEKPLASGATIGVTTETPPTEGAPVTITDASSANYSRFFFSDNALYETQNTGENSAQVVKLSANLGSFADGDGTPGNPYLIKTSDQLSLLAKKVDNGNPTDGKYYKLMAEINLNNAEWTPIGNATNAFKGSFDGDGNTIKNLKMDGGNYSGLFGWILGATVKNLIVSGGTVSGGQFTGAIVGYAASSTIENCHTDGGTVAGTSSDIGGIAGYLNRSTLSNSTNKAAVSSTAGLDYVGGVVGLSSGSSTVVNCVNHGNVTIKNSNAYSRSVGGVVGHNLEGTVKNCANYGAVTNSEKAQGTAGNDTKKATGGVVGRNEGGIITNCVSGGEVKDGVTSGSELGFVGGVVGYNNNNNNKTTSVVQFSYTLSSNDKPGAVGKNEGDITGCGTFAGTNGNITLGNDFVGATDKGTKTKTYVPNGTTALDTALNSWVESADATLNVNFWETGKGKLVPTLLAVTFDATGGSVTTIRAKIDTNKHVTLPTPTRSGYTFDGWYTAASGGTKITTSTEFTTSTTIYAHWTAYSGGGGAYIPPVPTTVDSGKEVSAFDLDTLASEGKTLTVNGKNGEKLVLDAETVKALAKAGGNLVVTVGDAKGKLTPEQAAQAGNRPVYDLTAILNGKIVTNFGGKITVSLPYLLKEGENAEDVTVWYLATDGSMTEIPATYDPKTGLATFTVTHFSKYVVGVWVNPFTDVKEGAWYFDAVKYVHKNGMFSGVTATIFAPNASTTRAMLWSVLARQAGQDTAGGANWYEKAQAWAIAKGVSDGTNPTGEITREQLVTMLWRYSGSPTATADLSKFTDADSVSAYAKQAMAWAVEKGIVSGTTATTLSPKSTAARAELASIMMRYTK